MEIKISDHALNEKLKQLVNNERQLLTEVLEHLKEVERRGLYSKRGYSSLFEYCVRELCYSESAAGRRISAMRLIKECPETKDKLKHGRLNLTTINLASQAFRQAKKDKRPLSLCEKKKFLKNIESKSRKEVEKELLPITYSKNLSFASKERVVSETHTELKIYLTTEQMRKLGRLKELKGIDKSNPELFEWMLDQVLKRIDPLNQRVSQKTLPQRECKKIPFKNKPLTPSRYISIRLKNHVWHKAKGCCEYRDTITGRHCNSKIGLEIDHVHPIAKGGKTEISNIRLLCRSHNQLMAQQHFGKSYIEGFYNK